MISVLRLHRRPRHARATSGSIDGMVRDYGNIPGLYAAGLYINGDGGGGGAREDGGGKTDDREALQPGAARGVAHRHAARAVHLRPPRQRRRAPSTSGGASRKGDKLVNTTIKTYPEGEPVLDLRREVVPGRSPVYSRDYPPLKAKGLGDSADAARRTAMNLWLVLAVNSITLGGLLLPAVRRLLADLRADADPQPDARLLLHAGRATSRRA